MLLHFLMHSCWDNMWFIAQKFSHQLHNNSSIKVINILVEPNCFFSQSFTLLNGVVYLKCERKKKVYFFGYLFLSESTSKNIKTKIPGTHYFHTKKLEFGNLNINLDYIIKINKQSRNCNKVGNWRRWTWLELSVARIIVNGSVLILGLETRIKPWKRLLYLLDKKYGLCRGKYPDNIVGLKLCVGFIITETLEKAKKPKQWQLEQYSHGSVFF